MSVASAVALALLPLSIAALTWRRVTRIRHVPRRLVLLMLAGGAAAGVLTVYVEHLVLGYAGLSLKSSANTSGALLASFLLVGPMEEGVKVLLVWPLHTTRRLVGPRLGLMYTVAAAAGFAAADCLLSAWLDLYDEYAALRLAVGAPAQLFFAGLWGYALGSGGRAKGRWFGSVWLVAMLLHALYDHIVFSRGPGLLVVAAPMFFAMALGGWIALRDVAPSSGSLPPSAPSSQRASLLSTLSEPPSLKSMRRALTRADRPLAPHWIGVGALVTLGMMIALLTAAVLLGHRLGIDFALADEEDMRATAPLLLLGVSLLAAFPFSGYLLARASSAPSVLEPALGAALAILLVLIMLSVTAPVAIVFALAVAPVAFFLACGGAWFGLER